MKQLMTITLVAVLATAVAEPAAAADAVAKDTPARIEAIPVQTLTISDRQFLKGDAYGRPTTIAGILRVAQGSGRLPAVVLVPGSGGIGAGADFWDRQFEAMGISTFMLDSFAGGESSAQSWINPNSAASMAFSISIAHSRSSPHTRASIRTALL
jgi:hypothetical protein